MFKIALFEWGMCVPVYETAVHFPQQIWLNLPYKLFAALTWKVLSLNFCRLLSCSIFKLVMWCQLSPDFEEVNLVKGTLSMSVWSRGANNTYPSLSITVLVGVLQCSFLTSYTCLPLPRLTNDCGDNSFTVAVAIFLLPSVHIKNSCLMYGRENSYQKSCGIVW